MLDEKTVVKKAFKLVLVFVGILSIFFFVAVYQGLPTYPGYYLIFIFGCVLIFFGSQRKRDDSSEEVFTATAVQRLTNLIVDGCICGVIITTIISFYPDPFIKLFRAYGKTLFIFICAVISLPVYYFIFETIFQRTPAKFLSGTKVVNQDLKKPGIVSMAIRTLARFIPFEPFSIFSKKGLWHDSLSKTYVI